MSLASERSERDTLSCNAIEISLYLFIYMVRRTSFSTQASKYVLVKHFQFYGVRGNPANSLACVCGKQQFVVAIHKQKLFAIASLIFLYLLVQ